MTRENGNTEQTTSSTTTSSPQLQSKPHDPELLMAARRGDWARLERLLLSRDGDTTALGAPQLVIPVDVEIMPSAAAAAPAAARERDSLLHMVASRGDGEDFLKSASVIHGKGRHLLDARDKNGDTPLHCAARAGCRGMVAHLVSLARSENGGRDDGRVRAMLRAQNKRGETVLHQAVRLGDGDMIGRLMAEDPQLARVPLSDGASPLYLAVQLGRDDIARQLYHKDPALSYSGPDGRNALHAAVLKGQDTTKMLLEWNRDLVKEADRSTGSTPLHLAASWGDREVISLLLAADPSAAYQSDSNGSFPIHVATFMDIVGVVSVLLDGRSDCAELRDAKGRTFLHVAVQEESMSVVTYICKVQGQKFASSVMNMQDDDGNTALHLAVKTGNLWILSPLMKNRFVMLNVTNNIGQTPLDLSWSSIPAGVSYGLNTEIIIHKLLQDAGAQNGTHRFDLFHENHTARLDQKEEAQKITTSTQIVGIGSVLIATVAFAAAFTLPGGYRGDDAENGGTPMLVGHSAFHVFIIANTLAFILSGLSITLLIYAGIVVMDIRSRMLSLALAAILMAASARSLSAAFVFGLYVVLAPVARTTAVATFAITALAFADAFWVIQLVCSVELVLLKRLGAQAWWRLARSMLLTLLSHFWPYIVIAGVVKCVKIKRDH
uniref:Uncharacterized protein n=1 Tax=Avena sativa TaxID=4498 RepID=A0ACD5YAY7_AVESA